MKGKLTNSKRLQRHNHQCYISIWSIPISNKQERKLGVSGRPLKCQTWLDGFNDVKGLLQRNYVKQRPLNRIVWKQQGIRFNTPRCRQTEGEKTVCGETKKSGPCIGLGKRGIWHGTLCEVWANIHVNVLRASGVTVWILSDALAQGSFHALPYLMLSCVCPGQQHPCWDAVSSENNLASDK